MADIRESVRNLFFNSVKAVNSAASSIAESTKIKVDEMNLRNRRREAMGEVSKTVHSLWQSGEALPEELMNLMEEIADIDEELEGIKAQAAAKREEAAAAKAAEAAKEEVVETAEGDEYVEFAEEAECAESVEIVDGEEAVDADAIVEDAVPVIEVDETAPYADAVEEKPEVEETSAPKSPWSF